MQKQKIAPELVLRDNVIQYLQDNAQCAVYKDLPQSDENVPYPFISIGTVHSTNNLTNNYILENIYIVINTWTKSDDDETTYNLLNIAQKVGQQRFIDSGYYLVGNPQYIDKQVITDDSTDTVLNHGIVSLQFKLI